MANSVAKMMQSVERYRQSGGRAEHFANKEMLELELALLFEQLDYERAEVAKYKELYLQRNRTINDLRALAKRYQRESGIL